MFIKFTSIGVALTLFLTFAGTPIRVSGQSKQDPKNTSETLNQSNETAKADLRADIEKLLAGLRAERDLIRLPRHQIQPPQRNNLSKGAKIGIGVAIAVTVVVVILVAKRCSNEQGC